MASPRKLLNYFVFPRLSPLRCNATHHQTATETFRFIATPSFHKTEEKRNMPPLDESSYRLVAEETAASASCQDDLSTRIEKILRGNPTCADCGSTGPQWASLLMNVNGNNCFEGLGVVLCRKCAVHHHYEVGDERCFIKYLQYSHEWSHPELDILEFSGNTIVNNVYEARSSSADRYAKDQAKFIKHKYKNFRWGDALARSYAQKLVALKCSEAKEAREAPAKRLSITNNLYNEFNSSMASDLDDSSFLDHDDVEDDDEEFYLKCARMARSTSSSSLPSLDINRLVTDPPKMKRSRSNPTLLAPDNKDRRPRKPSRRVSTDPDKTV